MKHDHSRTYCETVGGANKASRWLLLSVRFLEIVGCTFDRDMMEAFVKTPAVPKQLKRQGACKSVSDSESSTATSDADAAMEAESREVLDAESSAAVEEEVDKDATRPDGLRWPTMSATAAATTTETAEVLDAEPSAAVEEKVGKDATWADGLRRPTMPAMAAATTTGTAEEVKQQKKETAWSDGLRRPAFPAEPAQAQQAETSLLVRRGTHLETRPTMGCAPCMPRQPDANPGFSFLSISLGWWVAQALRAKSVANAWKRDTGKYETREQWAAVYRESLYTDAYVRARFMAGHEVLTAFLQRSCVLPFPPFRPSPLPRPPRSHAGFPCPPFRGNQRHLERWRLGLARHS